MKNKRFLITGTLLILVAVIASYLVTNRVYANALPELVEANISEPYVLTSTPPESIHEATPISKPSAMAKDLVNIWNEKNLSHEGWLHLVYQITSEVNNGVVLPDENQMATSYIEDGWYFVNQEGMIIKDVVTIKDLSGTILQQSAFSENIGINFTFGIRHENYSPYSIKIDRGVIQFLLDAENFEVSTSYREIDNQFIEFYYTENYGQPVQLSGIEELAKSTKISAVFNVETGEMPLYTKIIQTIDGSEILFEKNELILFEFLNEAPAEVLSVLENVK